jgi:aminoglycoside phosphotransferase (APT) family kinase protein
MEAIGTDVPGIDPAGVTAWFENNVPGATAPFTFELIAGGHSNLTFRVDGADGTRFVLRRPPLGHLLPSAHDMGREHRIISSLAETPVPVPPALGYCEDSSVNGAPFYVMGFVDGLVLRDAATTEASLPVAARPVAAESLVDTLAAIHAVDLKAVGLDDLGRHEGYIARQLRRWYGQWNASKTRELSDIDDVHAALSEHIPEQGPATIVHGDYRLDNCLIAPDGPVRAVLDWELCTLGDPLADVGLFHVYWTGPNDEAGPWFAATAVEGFPDRADLIARYASVSGRDLGQIDFYAAFSFWKLACILEGVYARYLAGVMGDLDRSRVDAFKVQVDMSAARAADFARRLR